MLFVDLDNTLIKSAYFLESFVKYFSQNIFAPFICIYVFARADKFGLKKFLYEKSNISIENLPYNKDVIDAIDDWKKDHPNEKVF